MFESQKIILACFFLWTQGQGFANNFDFDFHPLSKGGVPRWLGFNFHPLSKGGVPRWLGFNFHPFSKWGVPWWLGFNFHPFSKGGVLWWLGSHYELGLYIFHTTNDNQLMKIWFVFVKIQFNSLCHHCNQCFFLAKFCHLATKKKGPMNSSKDNT